MGIVTDRQAPADVPSTDTLRDLPDDDLLQIPPAYYKFGVTPAPIEDPLSADETGVYCVRVVCSGEHGPLIRGDGERRYERSMKIQAIWKLGEPEPPNPDDEQPGLFDENGEPTESESDESGSGGVDFSDKS